MRIAYVTTYDSGDIHKWSGLGFFIRQSSMVREGRNGKLFSLEDGPSAYASWILGLMSKPDGCRQLAASSRKEFEDRLNWGASGRALADILSEWVSCDTDLSSVPGRDH